MTTHSLKFKIPSFRFSSLLAVGLAMSIGWGIRGNFGHEYGAGFAGCLAALSVCLFSGRSDWRERILYFGFFGALGWGFGGSVSYMQVISYTESGHFSSQWYGYTCLFIIGFLWASLGGAGTALAAVADRRSLEQLFKPILFVFGAWYLLDLLEDPVSNFLQSQIQFDHTWSRHKSPLYWFDADYLAAFFALLGVGIYDLVDRRGEKIIYLPVIAGACALLLWLLQRLLTGTLFLEKLLSVLTYKLGDVTFIDTATGKPAFDADNLLNNWPQWFGDYPHHVGWVAGLVLGITVYFMIYGKFRNGSSLIVYMAGGWLLSFLAFPVLGSLFFTEIGGLRMTPPRGDDWAGITGVCIGTLFWMKSNSYTPVIIAMLVSGTIGGMGFTGIQWVKQLMMAPGNPRILVEEGILPGSPEFQNSVASWANWQQQNWHSFLEQSYGFVNGIAIAVALGLLASRLPYTTDRKEITGSSDDRKWTLGFAALFILIAIPYVNLFKNVKEWSDQLKPEIWKQVITLSDGSQETIPALWDLPFLGRLPGVDFLNLTPEGWFRLSWFLLAVVYAVIIRRHFKSPLSILSISWLGKGQLIFLMLVWLMVLGNFERALVGWGPSRLLTEWGIYVNSLLATVLVLLVPVERETIWNQGFLAGSLQPLLKKSRQALVVVILVFPMLLLFTNRIIYNYPSYEKLDKKYYHTRFGKEAGWKAKPILKNAEHK
jgi:hypothetical protein